MKLKLFFIILCFSGFGIVSFLPDLFNISGQIVTIGFRVLTFSLGIVVLFSNFSNLNFGNQALSILGLTIFYLLRLINDLFYSSLEFGRSGDEILMLCIGVSFFPAFVLGTIKNNNILRKAVNPLIILLTTICFLAIYMGLRNGFSYRLAGNSILNPISLGHVAASSLILIVVKYFDRRDSFPRLLLLSCFIISLFTIVMAASRGPLLALILVLGLFGFFYFKKYRKQLFIIALIITICAPVILSVSSSNGAIFTDRLHVDLGDGNSDAEARVLLWKTGIELFLENPIIGSQTTTHIGYPHNILIEILMSMGIIGGIVFLFLIISVSKKILWLLKNKDSLIWVGLLFFQYFLGAILSGTLYSSSFLWMSLGLFYSIDFRKIFVEKKGGIPFL